MKACICLWVFAQFYQALKLSFQPVAIESSLFAFWLITESCYVNVFWPFPTQPSIKVCWLLTTCKPKQRRAVTVLGIKWTFTGQAVQSNQGPVFGIKNDDGVLTPLGSTITEKFQRGSNTRGDNLYILFYFNKYQ